MCVIQIYTGDYPLPLVRELLPKFHMWMQLFSVILLNF